MKSLKDLFKNIEYKEWVGSPSTQIGSLEYDSRRVAEHCCFFAVVGTQCDGHSFIEMAISKGAVAIVCQRLPESLDSSVTYVVVEDSNVAMGHLASALYDHPSGDVSTA